MRLWLACNFKLPSLVFLFKEVCNKNSRSLWIFSFFLYNYSNRSIKDCLLRGRHLTFSSFESGEKARQDSSSSRVLQYGWGSLSSLVGEERDYLCTCLINIFATAGVGLHLLDSLCLNFCCKLHFISTYFHTSVKSHVYTEKQYFMIKLLIMITRFTIKSAIYK